MPSGSAERSADVVVIGAGIIGASIAWRLAQAGLKIILTDAAVVGGEASWAGAGMLAPGGEFDRASPRTEFALESLGLYRAFVEELRHEAGAEIDYQELGAVDLAFSEQDWRELRARAGTQHALGIPSEPLDHAQLRELVPLAPRDAAGALYFPRDSLVDPRHVTRALRLACERLGVMVREHCRVTAVREGTGSIEIAAGAAILRSTAAVIAAGAWSGGLSVWRAGEPVHLPPSFPIKGHLLGYRLAPGSLGPVVRHGHTYLVQRSSGFTVAGSSEEHAGFDRAIDGRIAADIHERACAVLPCLRGALPYEPWIGFRPAVEGLDPEIRRVEGSRIWLSYGHYRNGILLAPATARRVCAEITASWKTGSTSTGGPG